jgi:hypothetical protein
VKYSVGQQTKIKRFSLVSFSEEKMSTADATNSNNTSKNDEYIKLRVVGQDNSELLFI